jgi:hypothetical protein
MENWKQITDARVVDTSIIYMISDLGRILVIKNGAAVFKLGFLEKNGYLSVVFGHDDKRNIHRLVGEYFCERPEGTECINHLDGNKQNNKAPNLKWVTYAENNQHAFETGLRDTYGEKHWKSVSKDLVYKVYQLKKEGKKAYEIRDLIPELSYGALKGIYNGKNWRHEYTTYFGEKFKKTGRGGSISWNAIPEEKVLEIYRLKKEGKRIFQIATQLELGFHTVKHIFHGKNWKHLYKQHFDCPAITDISV